MLVDLASAIKSSGDWGDFSGVIPGVGGGTEGIGAIDGGAEGIAVGGGVVFGGIGGTVGVVFGGIGGTVGVVFGGTTGGVEGAGVVTSGLVPIASSKSELTTFSSDTSGLFLLYFSNLVLTARLLSWYRFIKDSYTRDEIYPHVKRL